MWQCLSIWSALRVEEIINTLGQRSRDPLYRGEIRKVGAAHGLGAAEMRK